MSHECIFEARRVPDADRMWMQRCRCHENVWSVRRDDDPAHLCPETGRQAPEPTQ